MEEIDRSHLQIECWEVIGRYDTLVREKHPIERGLDDLQQVDPSLPDVATVYKDWLHRAKPVLELAIASLGENNDAVERLYDPYERCLDAVNQISWIEAGRRAFASEPLLE